MPSQGAYFLLCVTPFLCVCVCVRVCVCMFVFVCQDGAVTYCPKKHVDAPGPGAYETRAPIGRGRLSKTTFGESQRERSNSVR